MSSMIESEDETHPEHTRRTNIVEADLKYIGIDTTELESYKQVEPRDGGKKLGFAIRTGLSLALEVELEKVENLCFELLRNWLNCE